LVPRAGREIAVAKDYPTVENTSWADREPKMGKYSVDGTTRRIAGTCSVVAGAVAVFWLMQRLRGHVPAGAASVADQSMLFFSLLGLCFAFVGSRRELSEVTTRCLFIYAALSTAWALVLAFELYVHGAPDLGRAGIVTFAFAGGLVGLASLIIKRRRPEAAQQAVAADGASPRR
jgi:hypothetical protein